MTNRTHGLVVLGILVVALSPAVAGPLFAPSYTPSVTFADALLPTTIALAFDGTNYWSCTGGSSSGQRLARYDAAGNLLNTYSPGLDFRSVFTDATGDDFARQFSNDPTAMRTIYSMTSPGTFSPSGVLLSGGPLNAQSSVVFDGDYTEFVAQNGGVVSRWDTSGSFLGTVNLIGYGTMGSESSYPQTRGIAAAGDYWLTYADGILSAWDTAGNRVDSTTLVGAGTTFDSYFSPSYANGMVFVVDYAGGPWRGYDVGLADQAVPEPASFLLLGLGAALLRRRRRRA